MEEELKDLIRFMCETWSKIDDWAYDKCGVDALWEYPVLQGTRNQMRIREIGKQPYNKGNIKKAVNIMLEANPHHPKVPRPSS